MCARACVRACVCVCGCVFWRAGAHTHTHRRARARQVHTFRFNGHSPADPEHERGRKEEKKWARAAADPIAIFEELALGSGVATAEELDAIKKKVAAEVKASVDFALKSPPPPRELAKELEFPDPPDTDYNARPAPADGEAVTARTVAPAALAECRARIEALRAKGEAGLITIGDAVRAARRAPAVSAMPLRAPSVVRVICNARCLSATSLRFRWRDRRGRGAAGHRPAPRGHPRGAIFHLTIMFDCSSNIIVSFDYSSGDARADAPRVRGRQARRCRWRHSPARCDGSSLARIARRQRGALPCRAQANLAILEERRCASAA